MSPPCAREGSIRLEEGWMKPTTYPTQASQERGQRNNLPSDKNVHRSASIGATPYIAFKSNATGEVGGLFEKMFHFYSYKRDEFLMAYDKRSNVETTFSLVKAKFGGHIRSKSETAQINEALCKVLCHNICCLIQSRFEFGIEPNFQTASVNQK